MTSRYIKQRGDQFLVMAYRSFRALAHVERTFKSRREADAYLEAGEFPSPLRHPRSLR